MIEKKYSVNLTGTRFLFYEIKQVIQLMKNNLIEKEIKTKIKEENLFQYEKLASSREYFQRYLVEWNFMMFISHI